MLVVCGQSHEHMLGQREDASSPIGHASSDEQKGPDVWAASVF